MKNIIYLLCLTTALIVSCSDPCDDVDCGLYGTCIDGECQCDPGYSGPNCAVNVCDTQNCNNGDCDPVTGECDCFTGYEGEFCDTETREKYLGVYSGDFRACIEEFIPVDSIPEAFRSISFTVSSDSENIEHVLILPTINLGAQNEISIAPEDGLFTIPTITTSFELEQIPFPVSITITGQGEFIDEETLDINLTIIVPLIQPIECNIQLKKD